jgi:hypothetical protein
MLPSLSEKKDSYNFINAADKGHHVVGTAHPSLGKKYCLVAFDPEVPRYIYCAPLPSLYYRTEKNKDLEIRCMKSIIASASPNYLTGACLVLHAP